MAFTRSGVRSPLSPRNYRLISAGSRRSGRCGTIAERSMRPVWRLLRWFWRAVTRQPSKTLLDRIKEEEEILYGLTTTFGELRAFGEALTSRVGQSKFVIANVTIWEAMLARRDLLTMHFAS